MPTLISLADELDTIDHYWHFDRLCKDLAKYRKEQPLKERQIKLLQGTLLGYKPQDISELLFHKKDSSSIRNALSRDLLPCINCLLSDKLDRPIEVEGARILIFLERAGYRKALMYPAATSESSPRLADFSIPAPDRVGY